MPFVGWKTGLASDPSRIHGNYFLAARRPLETA
jgi:hypothetical protein